MKSMEAKIVFIKGAPYKINLTVESLRLIEERLGSGVMVLAMKLASGMMSMEELACVLCVCCQPETTPSMCEDVVLNKGISWASDVVAELLIKALVGEAYNGSVAIAPSRADLAEMMERYDD